jgi:hypothetical protein
MSRLFVILFIFVSPSFLQNSIVPDSMVLIPGTTFQMGIEESKLEELAEMGKKVPHMSMIHSISSVRSLE